MTTYNQTTLKTFFQTNDVPTGSDYANLIDSYINVVDTSAQSMAGALNPTELITARVSATNGVFTGTLDVAGVANFTTVSAVNVTFQSTTTSALSVTVDVSAGGTVYASAMRSTNGVFEGVAIVSAAGVAQATAALLTSVINRGKGVADGATTGFLLPANKTGLTQVIINDAVSANLWPPTGGIINALAANGAFAMAANTPYIIYHITASAYAVK